MVVRAKTLTVETFAQLEEDGCAHELVEGDLVTMPPPGYEHAIIVMRIGRVIGNYVEQHKLGDVLSNGGFTIERDPDSVLAPDIAFVRSAGRPVGERRDTGYPALLPDLVIEVVSPSDTAAYVQRKVQKYLGAGIAMVAVIWPMTRTVSVHRGDRTEKLLTETDQLEGGEIIPGLSVAVADLFA